MRDRVTQSGTPVGCELRTSKSELGNRFALPGSNGRNAIATLGPLSGFGLPARRGLGRSNLEHFGFVSDWVLRISDFPRKGEPMKTRKEQKRKGKREKGKSKKADRPEAPPEDQYDPWPHLHVGYRGPRASTVPGCRRRRATSGRRSTGASGGSGSMGSCSRASACCASTVSRSPSPARMRDRWLRQDTPLLCTNHAACPGEMIEVLQNRHVPEFQAEMLAPARERSQKRRRLRRRGRPSARKESAASRCRRACSPPSMPPTTRRSASTSGRWPAGAKGSTPLRGSMGGPC